MTTVSKTKTLSSGHEMPVIGLGTWQSTPEEVEDAVTTALECGYRHIDTAYVYFNEEAIGKSLKKWIDAGNPREDLFVTTKLFPGGNRAADVELYLKASLKKLGLDYIDMYLIHVPFGVARGDDMNNILMDGDRVVLDYDTDHVAIWKEMEKQVEAGLVRSIGVSNFNESQILNIISNTDIKPSNLQTEIQAYNQMRELREFCAEHNIAVTAYSTFGSPGCPDLIKSRSHLTLPKLLEYEAVVNIAENHDKTPAQVLLRHQIQGDLIVIPKSVKPERIKENFDVFSFELSEDEMKRLDELDIGEVGRMLSFKSVFKGAEKHPQFTYP